MGFKSLSLIITFLLSAPILAASRLLIIGGSGEPQCTGAITGPHSTPKCEGTIFDSTLKDFSRNIEMSPWRYQLSFNGGHPETEKLLKWKFPSPEIKNSNFTAVNYDKLIKDYEAKINLGEIKSGDKLMIIIAAHGAYRKEGEIAHSIMAAGKRSKEEKDNLSLSSLVSLDSLSNLVKLADQKGIKLGIVDLSCRSGNTLALASGSKNTCVISATGLKHYGYMGPSGFSHEFLDNLKHGRNLEEVFLKARLNSFHAEYPMISTDMNDRISYYFYENITPYIYYSAASEDLLTNYLIKNSKLDLMCKREEQFKNLIDKISELEKLTADNFFNYNGMNFKQLLRAYKNNQDQILIKLKNTNGLLENTETIGLMMKITGEPEKPLDLELTWNKILTLDLDKTIKQFERFAVEGKTLNIRENNKYVAELFKLVAKRRAEILKKHPELKNIPENAKKLIALNNNSKELADKIIIEEKKLYSELYKRYSSVSKSNPCREFTF